MKILGIETSCDETAVSLIEIDESGDSPAFTVHENIVLSQAEKHAQYGGVYPNLAKREHAENLPLLTQDIFNKHNVADIDAIAVTAGPGLAPALWVGVTHAQELAEKYNLPIIPVNHMEGHIYSVFAGGNTFSIPRFDMPLLALLVSGGHTELVLSTELGTYEKIGQTLDDAAGEAFDKVARLLDLPYPGGPHISRLAAENVVDESISLPRPMMHSKDYRFSFSGLKTSVLYLVKKLKEENRFDEHMKKAIAYEFQEAVCDVLVSKTKQAVEEYGAQTLVVAGGVSANQRLVDRIRTEIPGIDIYTPDRELTGDNSLMIAVAGYFQYKNTTLPDPDTIRANANLSL